MTVFGPNSDKQEQKIILQYYLLRPDLERRYNYQRQTSGRLRTPRAYAKHLSDMCVYGDGQDMDHGYRNVSVLKLTKTLLECAVKDIENVCLGLQPKAEISIL